MRNVQNLLRRTKVAVGIINFIKVGFVYLYIYYNWRYNITIYYLISSPKTESSSFSYSML